MPKPKVKLELYLVRHGKAASIEEFGEDVNADIYKKDPPLSDVGIRQAELLGEYFEGLKFDYIFSSGLRRALRTAYEVCIRQPEDGTKQVEVNKVFTECGVGEDYEGRTIDEIREDLPIMVSALGTDEKEKIICYSKDYTDEQLLERGKEAISYLLNRFHNGEKVMVAAHAAFNTFMMYAALGIPCDLPFDPSYYNTGITKIVFYEEGTGEIADVHLVFHNNVPHLCGEMPEFRY